MSRKFYNGIDLQGKQATNAGDPSTSGDLATKNYVDVGVNVPVTRTANVTLTLTDSPFQRLNASGGTFTVTLPTTTTPGKRFQFKKDNSTTAVSFAAGATIGGVTSMQMKGVGQWIEIVSTTTSDTWEIVSAGPVLVPSGTSITGIPDGLLFVEYTP